MEATPPAVERGGGAPLTGSHPALGLDLPGFLGGSARAACADHNPELWFSLNDGGGAAAAQAREICRGCPLLRPCTAWALTHAVHGIWGALSVEERRQLQHRHGLPERVPGRGQAARIKDVETEES